MSTMDRTIESIIAERFAPRAFHGEQSPNGRLVDEESKILVASTKFGDGDVQAFRQQIKANGGNLKGKTDAQVKRLMAERELFPQGRFRSGEGSPEVRDTRIYGGKPRSVPEKAVYAASRAAEALGVNDFARGLRFGGIDAPARGIAGTSATVLRIFGSEEEAQKFDAVAQDMATRHDPGRGFPGFAGRAIGSAAPTVAALAATGGGSAPVMFAYGVTAFGNAGQDYRLAMTARGLDTKLQDEIVHSTGAAAIEIITERLGLEALGRIGARGVSQIGDSIIKGELGKAAMSLAIASGQSAASNAVEEILAEVTNNVRERYGVLGLADPVYPDKPLSQGLGQAGLGGAIAGGVIGGGVSLQGMLNARGQGSATAPAVESVEPGAEGATVTIPDIEAKNAAVVSDSAGSVQPIPASEAIINADGTVSRKGDATPSREQVRADVASFFRANGTEGEIVEPESDQQRRIQQDAAARGVNVLFVRGKERLGRPAASPSPGVVLIDADLSPGRQTDALAWHEMVHEVDRRDPEAWQDLNAALSELVPDLMDAAQRRYQEGWKRATGEEITPEILQREGPSVAAELVIDAIMAEDAAPGTLSRAIAANPSLKDRIISVFQAMLTRLGMRSGLTRLEEARQTMDSARAALLIREAVRTLRPYAPGTATNLESGQIVNTQQSQQVTNENAPETPGSVKPIQESQPTKSEPAVVFERNRRPGEFSRRDVRRKLKQLAVDRGFDPSQAEDLVGREAEDAATEDIDFTFPGKLPAEITEALEGQPPSVKMYFLGNRRGGGGEDVMSAIGADEMVRRARMLALRGDVGVDDYLGRRGDPELEMLRFLEDQRLGPIEVQDNPSSLPDGAVFTIAGDEFVVYTDEGTGHKRMTSGSRDLSLAVPSMPIDKGSMRRQAGREAPERTMDIPFAVQPQRRMVPVDDLVFTESDQSRLREVREWLVPGMDPEDIPPLAVVQARGEMRIIDGHNRAVVAKEIGIDRVPVVRILEKPFNEFKRRGFDEIEIAAAMMENAGEFEQASALDSQFNGAGVSRAADEIHALGIPFAVRSDRPYGNAPDSLMGFRKDAEQRGFYNERYRMVQAVRVTYPDGHSIEDEIRGLNQPHAMERARRNWEGATVEPLGEPVRVDPANPDIRFAARDDAQQDLPNARAREAFLPEGRPDLANPALDEGARRFVNTVDHLRNIAGEPVRMTDAEVEARADRMMQTNGSTVEQALKDKVERGGLLDDVETVVAQRLVNRRALEAVQKRDRSSYRAALELTDTYRQSGTLAARAFRQRRDQLKGPAERYREALMRAFLEPDLHVRERLKAIRDQLNDDTISQRRRKKLTAEKETLFNREARKIGRVHEDLVKQGYDPRLLTEEAMMDPMTAARVIDIARRARTNLSDGLYWVWMNSILSGPLTHMANIGGNLLNFGWRFGGLKGMEAVAGSIQKRFGGEADFTLSDYKHMWKMMGPALAQGYTNMVRSYATNRQVFDEQITGEVHSGPTFKGEAVRLPDTGPRNKLARAAGLGGLPLKLLMAEDQFFKTVAGVLEANALAHHQAVREGLKGDQRTDRVTELLQPRTGLFDEQYYDSDIWNHAYEDAQIAVFQDKPSRVGQMALELRNGAMGGLLKWFIPFVRTPDRLFVRGIETSPLGIAYHGGKAVFKGAEAVLDRDFMPADETSGAHNLAAALGAVGILAAIWGWKDDEDGFPRITGSREQDYKLSGEQYRTAPPFSIRIGSPQDGKWYSYSRIEPLSTGIALTIDLLDQMEGGDNLGEATLGSVDTLIALTHDKTFVRSIGQLVETFSSPFRNSGGSGEKLLELFSDTFINAWVPNLFKQGVRAYDPTIVDNRAAGDAGFWEKQATELPYNLLPSSELAPVPRYDLWGRPIKKDSPFGSPAAGFLWRLTVPIAVSEADLHPMDLLIYNYNEKVAAGEIDDALEVDGADARGEIHLRPPARYFTRHGERVDLTAAEYQAMIKNAGERASERLLSMDLDVADPSPRDVRRIKDTFKRAYSRERDRIWRERRESAGD